MGHALKAPPREISHQFIIPLREHIKIVKTCKLVFKLCLCNRLIVTFIRTLRSSVQGDLVIPFARSATMQSHSFSVVGPTTLNGLRSKAPPKQCLFSVSPTAEDCSVYLAGVGSAS